MRGTNLKARVLEIVCDWASQLHVDFSMIIGFDGRLREFLLAGKLRAVILEVISMVRGRGVYFDKSDKSCPLLYRVGNGPKDRTTHAFIVGQAFEPFFQLCFGTASNTSTTVRMSTGNAIAEF
jgi:hypothetical protein